MTKLIKRILILTSVLVLMDFIIGTTLNQILINSPDGRYFKANYSLKNCNEDIIIFGSSRAETNYAPFIFEDLLNLSCWNTGRGGQSLPFWYAMEKGVLARYTPKIAIINVERDFLSSDLNNGSYERAGFLRPFYYGHPEIRPLINKISKHERILLISKTYAFNSSFYYLFRPYLIKGLDGRKDDKGWKTRKGVMQRNETELRNIKTARNLNLDTMKLFEEFLQNLTSKGCKVYVVASPNHGVLVESTSTFEHIKRMKNIHFINFSNDIMLSNNSKLYKDPNHLNVDGAVEFSKRVCRKIVEYERRNMGIAGSLKGSNFQFNSI
jgi:hypothetical protein